MLLTFPFEFQGGKAVVEMCLVTALVSLSVVSIPSKFHIFLSFSSFRQLHLISFVPNTKLSDNSNNLKLATAGIRTVNLLLYGQAS